MKGALEVECLSLSLSLKRLSGEGLEGGSFTGDPGRYVTAPIRASLCIGAPLRMKGTWDLEGARIPGTLKDE